MNGTVKFFNQEKGFGFIQAEDGKEYFVHQTGLEEGVTINDGDEVTFEVAEGDRGPKAVNVTKGGEGSAESDSEDEDKEAA